MLFNVDDCVILNMHMFMLCFFFICVLSRRFCTLSEVAPSTVGKNSEKTREVRTFPQWRGNS